nr:SRPBCC family protein [Georgenia muralis]
MRTVARVEHTTMINAPVEEVFAFAKDLGKLWDCWPDVRAGQMTDTPHGVGSRAEFFIKVLGPMHMQGHVDLLEMVPNERLVVKSSFGPRFTFTFAPHDGATAVTIVVEWSYDTPIVGAPMESLTARRSVSEFLTFLANVKAAIEGIPAEEVEPAEDVAPGVLTRSVLIDAPVERVYEDVLDIGTFWTGAPDVAMRSVRRTPDGVGTSARIYTHWLGAHMEGGLEIVEAVRPERVVAKVTFGPESPMWTFTLEPVDGGTRLSGQGRWHLGVPVVGKRFVTMMAASHEEFLEQMLAGAKERLEAPHLAMA